MTDYDDSHLDYAYDAAGHVTSMNDYHSHTTTYTYTDTGQVSTITAPGSKTWTYAYNALGQPTSVGIPNGMTSVYAYDNRNRLTKIQHKNQSVVLQEFEYNLTDSGNIYQVTHADDSRWYYQYDGRGRLSRGIRYDPSNTVLHQYTYTYDDADNLITKQTYEPGVGTFTETFAYDGANQLTTWVSGISTMSYAYDQWGRMTSSSGLWNETFTYRYGGKLHTYTKTITGGGGAPDIVTYEYGGDGKRRSRVEGTDETWYNWTGGWKLVSEEDDAGGTGNLTTTYFGSAADVAGTNPSTGSYRYYFHDHLGSTRGLRAQDKSLLGVYEYTPYGQIYAESDGSGGAAASITHKFTGHDQDATTGLYFAPYRYYAPYLARWTTRDPLGMVDGPNLYAYVAADPILGRDPLGLKRRSGFRKPTVEECMTFDKKCRMAIINDMMKRLGALSIAVTGALLVGCLVTRKIKSVSAALCLVAGGMSLWDVYVIFEAWKEKKWRRDMCDKMLENCLNRCDK